MRQIGTLPDRAQASRLAAYLITQGISCEAEEEDEGGPWSLWVHDENQVAAAKQKLESFRDDPEGAEFSGHEAKADEIVKQKREQRTEAQRNMVDMRRNWARPPGARTPLVMSLMLLTVLVSVVTGMGGRLQPGSLGSRVRGHLQFVTPAHYQAAKGDSLASIKRGQLWRLVTPAFLHFGIMHLVFNMFMFYQLGRLLELKLGPPRLALMMLAIAVLSNLAQGIIPPQLQQVLGGSANFGGMSGVVFGLFGYAWVRSQIDPAAGYMIPATTVFIMLGWLVLCLTPVIPNIANAAHIVGLICGMVAAQIR